MGQGPRRHNDGRSTGTGHGGGRAGQGGGRGGGRGRPRGPARDQARNAAFDVMRAVDERDAYANLLMPRLLRERGVKGRDAALATELAYGTLRGLGTYDAIIEMCVDRTPDADVRDALRLGAHQLLKMRVPPHAAVGTTVDLVRLRIGSGAAKFANAVLRKIGSRTIEEWIPIVAPDRAHDPAGHLSVAYSHPRWIVSAFRDALGIRADEVADLLAADNERPLVTLVARPGRSSVEELTDSGADPARYSPYAAYLPEGDPGRIPAVAETRAAVQDEASQLVALALTRVPLDGRDELWLDMCAGPGGKAGLLDAIATYGDLAASDDRYPADPVGPGVRAVAYPGGARLLAADVQYHRARLVWQTTRDAAVVAADGTEPAWRPGAFDRIMLDAPCTGLGALRRRPEARWRRDPADIAELGRLQRRLLDAALDAVRPGGVVAYVTCSPHLAETRVVVGDIAGRRGDVEQLDARDYLPEIDGLGDGPHAQFWPHRHGTDAMFLALLRKRPL
ncbi:RsmB/NOP family class I SAM-dependent RNA methyltransferase [Nonomuraea aurantiaca]|uniref:RsmB/NOP family class I SAM-dependent RNA methyltransferase n=1 Tax=Nonomuraea aurantiaca TaxID=2878562 RepID=UPI001CD9E35F|nr:transcription antitermination factor NusB [Nonomuraea aurantiaca]MCA2226960.1 rRNA cytosine-C5-methyltransferase [Nonomuraea aurantiaca]